MELLMKDGNGELVVNNLVLNFKYEEIDEENKIYFEKDLEDPILQIVVLEKKLHDIDFNEIEISVPRKLKNLSRYLLDSTYLLKHGDREIHLL